MWGMRVFFVSVLVYMLLSPAYAADIAVSASVPLSERYIAQIQEHSSLSIQRKNWVYYITGVIEDGTAPIASTNYDLIIVSDTGKLEVRKRDTTSDNGVLTHVFIPERSRSYTLFLINTTYLVPFIVASAQM